MLASAHPHLTVDAARHAGDLLAAGRARAALALVNRALRGGERADLRLLRARALLAFRAEAEAERDLVRCLRLEPSSLVAHQLLCELALRRGDLAAAELFLKDSLRLSPDDERTTELAYVVLGWRRARAAARRARRAAAPRRAAALAA
jgi:uncharacterized protein HemY